jgi:hypothetical protein
MSRVYLLFAGVATAYIIVGVGPEERDLRRASGDTYEEYRRRVGMPVPGAGHAVDAGRPGPPLRTCTRSSGRCRTGTTPWPTPRRCSPPPWRWGGRSDLDPKLRELAYMKVVRMTGCHV